MSTQAVGMKEIVLEYSPGGDDQLEDAAIANAQEVKDPAILQPTVDLRSYRPLHNATLLMPQRFLEQVRNLMESIKTMNWTGFLPQLILPSLALLTTPGPSEHPHSALLPPKT